MPEISQETVNATFLEVVEQLTFMFGESEDKNVLATEGVDFICGRMSFTGDLAGSITLAVPSAITVDIAANILGLEPEDLGDEAILEDALGEMLNVACGHVIMALIGTEADFKLASPVVGPVGEAALVEMLTSPDFVGFNLDDNPVLLGLKTES